ncbi:glycoside hydrolase family 5 protein [Cellvibrio mixtus]|uniref:glycoside hydrolase family 5 protein n=1 Tax=Cellvibrio mixtus TaxID=39650 RepID=UPI000B1C83F9|nr:glycoside hydrolase family 5 protein [Cellvibrio mixtus]
MKIIPVLSLSLSILFLSGCGGGGGNSKPATNTSTVGSAPVSSNAGVSSVALSSSSQPSSVVSSSVVSSSIVSSSIVSSSIVPSSSSASNASLYPDYNINPLPADNTGMTSTATQIASHIKLGWNIGNTLEAIGGETSWGNPLVTNELIQTIKANGFDAVRIPAAWDQYANQQTAKIDSLWLDRVKQVITYCMQNNLYVVLNIHWDGGWLENNVTPAKQSTNIAKQKAFWQQIATHLRDFDEHLLFASANEPNVETAEQMALLNQYHQTFVEAVRATGGKNAHRVLIVQGPGTDIERTNTLWTRMPTDTIANKLMAEVHFYTPYNFALMQKDESWGKQFYYWGTGFHSTTDTDRNPTWGEEATVDQLFGMMKKQFVDNGIPVILGEYAAMRRTNLTGDSLALHLASRAYYLKYVTQQALANGLNPFYWDAGGLDNFGSGIFNRKDNTVFDQQALNALLEGAGKK